MHQVTSPKTINLEELSFYNLRNGTALKLPCRNEVRILIKTVQHIQGRGRGGGGIG